MLMVLHSYQCVKSYQEWTIYRSIAPPNTQELVDYFDHTYVNGTVRRPAASSAQSSDTTANVTRRIPPLYEPRVWNVCNITLNEGDRTNNFSEAWNRKYSSMVGHEHPSIWTAIELLQADVAENSTVLLKHNLGTLDAKKRRRNVVKSQERLRSLCLDYQNKKRNMENFMQAIGHIIRLVEVLDKA